MTNHTSYITRREQLWWYVTTYRRQEQQGKMKCFVISVNGKGVGYALITHELKKYWLTIAVMPQYRSNGFGSSLLKLALNAVYGPLYIEVIKDNTATISWYEKKGFKVIRSKRNLTYLKYE